MSRSILISTSQIRAVRRSHRIRCAFMRLGGWWTVAALALGTIATIVGWRLA